MDFISWKPSLAVGIDIIDTQHKNLIDIANTLKMARIEKNREKVRQLLFDLQYYVSSHFAYEEKLMDIIGYPLADAHLKTHQIFVSRINEHLDLQREGKCIIEQLMVDLDLWLYKHIAVHDKDLAPYISEKREFLP